MSIAAPQDTVGKRSSVAAPGRRAEALAGRLEQGAAALAAFAAGLTDAEWRTPVPHDGRSVGVCVHHVGNMYPLEIQLAQAIAAGQPIVGVTMENVHHINAEHAKAKAGVTKAEALEFLRQNSAAAAAAI